MDLSTTDVRLGPLPEAKDVLSEVLRLGAQQLLAQAIEAAVADWIDQHCPCLDEHGHRQIVRNGRLPARTLTTGGGPSRSSSHGSRTAERPTSGRRSARRWCRRTCARPRASRN